MNLDEMLAVMAAPIYAAKILKTEGGEASLDKDRMMRQAVEEARLLWRFARIG